MHGVKWRESGSREKKVYRRMLTLLLPVVMNLLDSPVKIDKQCHAYSKIFKITEENNIKRRGSLVQILATRLHSDN